MTTQLQQGREPCTFYFVYMAEVMLQLGMYRWRVAVKLMSSTSVYIAYFYTMTTDRVAR